MPSSSKRDSAYYERRLMAEHPKIHTDLVAGRYPSVRAASIAAGLQKPRSRLAELQNAWTKASPLERQSFVKWLKGSLRPISLIVDTDGRLLPRSITRICEIMDRRRLKLGDVMDELGFPRRDASLGNAMRVKQPGTRLRPQIVQALEKWLKTNSHI